MTNKLTLTLGTLLASIISASAQKPAAFPSVNTGRETRGMGIVSALGGRLPEVARHYGMSEKDFGALCLREHDMRADKTGRLFYVCEGATAQAPTAQNAGTNALLTYPSTETFLLNSKPGAARVLYLDFTGHTTSGTSWNSGATFTSPAYDTDANPAAFSTTELANIQDIWKRVSEDYAAWDVNVTTQEPPLESLRKTTTTDTSFGVRMVIGGSSGDWYGASAGGVAYIGSFSWNSDTPAFVFPVQLGNGYPKYVAEAISHEAGHTVGLNHDGVTGGEAYYQGHNGWAPIMGVGYYATLSQFSKGEYLNANNAQDDTAIIDTYIPRTADLAGDDILTAVPLSGTTVSATGNITTRDDADLYKVNSGAGTLSFTATPATPDANLDIILGLYDGSGNLITTANPTTTLGATLSTTVAPGTYYLSVNGTSKETAVTGYTDYASLGQFSLTGSVPALSGLPPVAVIAQSAPLTGPAPLTVNFSSAGSSDPEGTVLTYDWDFGDGTGSTEPNPAHTYTTAGTFTASLVVYDETGLSSSASVNITTYSAANVIYVSNIAMTKVVVNKRGTQAKAAVTIKDATGKVIPGAAVTGKWSGLTTGTTTLTTGSTGTATFSSALTKNAGTFTFTITGVSLSGATYDATKNVETVDSIAK